jgi:hypothetical protein
MEMILILAAAVIIIICLPAIMRNSGRRPQAKGLFTHRCPSCGDIVYDKYPVCANCHAPQPKTRWLWREGSSIKN